MSPTSSAVLRRAGLWLLVIWLAVLVLAFYPLHWSLLLGGAGSLLWNAVDIAAVLLLVVIGGAVGTLLLPDAGRFSAPEMAALRALLGLGAIGLLLLLAGLLALYPPRWLAWAISLSALAALHRPAWMWLGGVRQALRSLFDQPAAEQGPLRRFGRWVIAGTLALLALTISQAFAPPTEWDALIYHLAGPRLYIDAGRIYSFPELPYLGFPFLAEMLYLWLMLLGRAQAAALLHGVFGLLALAMIVGAAGRLGRPSAGWLAALILLLGAEFWEEFHYAYTDLALTAYSFAAFLFLATWTPETDRGDRAVIWAGVFAGLAMGVKYTAAMPAIGLGVLALWLARRRGVGRMLRAGALLTAVSLAVFLPWAIKNVVMLGNPVAPLLFETVGFDALHQYYYTKPGTGIGARALLAPLESTLLGQTPISRFDATPGPLLVGLLPLAAVAWGQRRADERDLMARAAVAILPAYLIWLYGVMSAADLVSIRLLYPVFPLIALLAGFGVEGLREARLPIPLVSLARGVVLLSLVASVAFAVWQVLAEINTLRVAVGLVGEEDYLTESLPAHYTAMQKVNALPEESRILFLWEPRIFYCQRDCIPDSILDRWWHDYQLEPDPRRIAQQWRAQGVTHVLIFEAAPRVIIAQGIQPLDAEDFAALEAVREQDMTLIWDGADAYDVYSLYELKR